MNFSSEFDEINSGSFFDNLAKPRFVLLLQLTEKKIAECLQIAKSSCQIAKSSCQKLQKADAKNSHAGNR